MKLLILCPRWGSESLAPREFIRRVREAGYDGVEIALADGDKAAMEAVEIAKSEGLALVTQHYETLDTDSETHAEHFERRLRHAASAKPLFVNSHTGRDLFSLEKNLSVFAIADRVAQDTGIPVFHETHRGRCLHSPWRTAELLAARPATKLVFDMSHWWKRIADLRRAAGAGVLTRPKPSPGFFQPQRTSMPGSATHTAPRCPIPALQSGKPPLKCMSTGGNASRICDGLLERMC